MSRATAGRRDRSYPGRRLSQWDHRCNVDFDYHAWPSELADGEERMGGHRRRSEGFLAALAKVRLISHVSKVALAMLASAALGGLAVQGLHAQAKPPVYYIAEIDVTNPDAYAKEYAPKAQALIKSHGGRFLAMGGAAATGSKVTAFDGEAPKRVVVQVWDSMDKIQAWRSDPAYKELRQTGDKYAKFRSFAVEGMSQ
jgi:uncharacterized protein (DUF1330 family)